ncbi:MAG: hypothetical protein ABSB41_17810 [Anaerolineales bacterium]|jgi:hypothetical protein
MDHQIEPRHPIPAAPIHPFAALATIVLDNLFAIPDLAGPELWIFTVPLIGGICLLTTTMVQHYLAKDSWGESIAKGLVMGIIAGVPISVTGTAVGGILLGWAGLHEWVKLPALKGPPPVDDQEIVDAEVKEVDDHQNR